MKNKRLLRIIIILCTCFACIILCGNSTYVKAENEIGSSNSIIEEAIGAGAVELMSVNVTKVSGKFTWRHFVNVDLENDYPDINKTEKPLQHVKVEVWKNRFLLGPQLIGSAYTSVTGNFLINISSAKDTDLYIKIKTSNDFVDVKNHSGNVYEKQFTGSVSGGAYVFNKTFLVDATYNYSGIPEADLFNNVLSTKQANYFIR